MNDEIFNQVVTLLIDCRYADKRSRKKAERAINLWEKADLGSIYLAPRGLIYYPDLLEKYLTGLINRKVTRTETNLLYSDDLASMICRCIEDVELTLTDSLNLLLNYYQQQMKGQPINLKLLPGKYNLNYELYFQSREIGIRDEYLDSRLEGRAKPYLELSPQKLKEESLKKLTNDSNKVFGYRESYHRLIYTKDRQCLTDWWREHGYDCTAEAACDYFGVSISKDGERNQNDRIDLETQQELLKQFNGEM